MATPLSIRLKSHLDPTIRHTCPTQLANEFSSRWRGQASWSHSNLKRNPTPSPVLRPDQLPFTITRLPDVRHPLEPRHLPTDPTPSSPESPSFARQQVYNSDENTPSPTPLRGIIFFLPSSSLSFPLWFALNYGALAHFLGYVTACVLPKRRRSSFMLSVYLGYIRGLSLCSRVSGLIRRWVGAVSVCGKCA